MLIAEAASSIRRLCEKAQALAEGMYGREWTPNPNIEFAYYERTFMLQMFALLDITCMLGFTPRRWGGSSEYGHIVLMYAIHASRTVARDSFNFDQMSIAIANEILKMDAWIIRHGTLPDEWQEARDAWDRA